MGVNEKDRLILKTTTGDPEARSDHGPPTCYPHKTSKILLYLFLATAVVALTVGVIVGTVNIINYRSSSAKKTLQKQTSPPSEVQDGAHATGKEADFSQSKFGIYRHAAAATDIKACSSVAIDIFQKQGSTVDAAVASVICLGLQGAQSSGIGGGNFMLIYDTPRGGTEKEFAYVDAREVAPKAAHRDMFTGDYSKATQCGVPGDILGLYEAWQRFGRLPWADLLQPTIDMCVHGFTLARDMADSFSYLDESDPLWRELFMDSADQWKKAGDTVYNAKLGNTLRTLAEEGPHAFYNGSLAKLIVKDIQEKGGIITLEDLRDYSVKWKQPTTGRLESVNLNLYTSAPPGGGPIFQFMLRLLEGFNLKPEDINTSDNKIETYHKILEVFKFGISHKTYMADPDFEDMSQLMRNITSAEYIDFIRERIDWSHTHNTEYYNPAHTALSEGGTSHASFLGPDGSAVSMTNTVNTEFGCKIRGRRTGIVFNDEMSDFDGPGDDEEWGYETSHVNFVAPGKRPTSSMSPAILVDDEGRVVLTLGTSGGSRITTTNTFVAANALWFDKLINEAVDEPRIHHRFLPPNAEYEPGVTQRTIKGLEEKGHIMELRSKIGKTQAIKVLCHNAASPCIYATSDRRKYGAPDGY